ncbi:hypothetical protein [Nocardia salmonicida]|uniref:Integral membrane protein n=1 Tax=Nocardia salmonicida TaxID=53431 RepID=A0ABZ1NFR1_9NOCA
MTSIAGQRPGLLPTVLRVDGWSTGLFGIAMAAAAPLLRDPLGLPVPVSLLFGVVMLTGGATLLAIARGGPARFAPAVIAVNALSAIGMTALAATDIFALTTTGIAFLLTGATVVATFAALEHVGLRRADR